MSRSGESDLLADRKEIILLANEVLRHKKLYYGGSPEISDAEFDKLEERLRTLDPQHPALSQVGAPGAEAGDGSKVRHRIPMLSLAKTYEVKELESWSGNRPLVGMYKIDGNSLSLMYHQGSLSLAKTRGNGEFGEDVTAKVRKVSECCPQLADPVVPALLEVRGELYCSFANFSRLLGHMQTLGLEAPSSPRNIVAGILGRKQHTELARYFSFFAFDVLVHGEESPGFQSEQEKLLWLEKQGFSLPVYRPLSGIKEVQSFLDETKGFMDDGQYGIDGAVFTLDRLSLHQELGSTAHHPRFRMSFKWQGETAETTIKNISWSTSRLGVVTPVAVTEPVFLSNAVITNITLHNAAHVQASNLKPGDRIEIVRSGEVIPKFLGLIKSAKGQAELPELCPSCNSPLNFDGVRLLCPASATCPDQIMGSILNWIRCAGIDDLSEKRLTSMLEMKMITHMSDLYTLDTETLIRLPLTKEKMAQKLVQNIQGSRKIPLVNFLNGLGIKGMGPSMWELLLDQYPGLEELQKAGAGDICNIKGFAEKTAHAVVDGLKEKTEDIRLLLKAGVAPQAVPSASETGGGGIFSGNSFVLTGTMSRPRNELADLIKKKGGKVASSVSKTTTALIIADPQSGSSKAKKARDLGIALWSEDKLMEMLSQES